MVKLNNRVLRKIFGPKRDDVTGKWRRLHSAEFYDLLVSPNIIWVIKSRQKRWTEHVAPMEKDKERCIQGFGGET